jgi:hypothetical protein
MYCVVYMSSSLRIGRPMCGHLFCQREMIMPSSPIRSKANHITFYRRSCKPIGWRQRFLDHHIRYFDRPRHPFRRSELNYGECDLLMGRDSDVVSSDEMASTGSETAVVSVYFQRPAPPKLQLQRGILDVIQALWWPTSSSMSFRASSWRYRDLLLVQKLM